MGIQVAVVAGGKTSASGTWTPAESPGTASDLQVTSATTGNMETSSITTPRSLNFAPAGEEYGAHEWKWSAQLSINGSAAGEGSNKGVALKLSKNMIVSLSGSPKLKFASSPAESLTLTSAEHTLPALEIAAGTSATLTLADALNISTSSISVLKGTLDTNGKAVSAASLICSSASAKSLTLGASIVKLTGTGIVYDAYSAGTPATVSAASSTIEMTGAEATFIGVSGKTYGTLIANCATKATLLGPATEPTEGTANLTCSTLALNSAENVIGGRVVIKITTALTTTATSGSKKKLISGKAGTKGILNLGGKTVTLEGLELKDIEVEEGTLIVLGGVNLGSNSGNIFFAKAVTLNFSQSQSVAAPVKQGLFTRSIAQTSSVTKQQSISLTKQTTQSIATTATKVAGKALATVQGQIFSVLKSGQRSLLVEQSQTISQSKIFERVMSLIQGLVAQESKSSSHSFFLLQGQSASRSLILERLVSALQNVSAIPLRGLEQKLTVAQSQTVEAIMKVGKKTKLTQPQNTNVTMSIPRIFSLVQSQGASVARLVPKTFSLVQEQALTFFEELKSLAHFHPISIFVSQETNSGIGKFTNKVISVAQPVIYSFRKEIGRKITATQSAISNPFKAISITVPTPVQNVSVTVTSTLQHLYGVAINVFQNVTSAPGMRIAKRIEVLQNQSVKVGKGFSVSLSTVVSTLANPVRSVLIKLGILEQPSTARASHGLARQFSSGELIWVKDVDKLISNPQTSGFEFIEGSETTLDHLGQYEGVLIPGDPDVFMYVLRKPKKVGQGTTNDPSWQ